MPNTIFPSGTQALSAYLAVPEGDGPWPGIVMIHDGLGLNADLRRQADHMAARGYLVLAPDLYSGGNKVGCIAATVRTMARGKGPALAHITAAREHLIARPDCTGKTAVIGFCMGGMFAIMVSTGYGFDAVAPNYGMPPPWLEVDDFVRQGCAPLVGSYGDADFSIPEHQVQALEKRLTELDVPHDITVYPETTHSFFQDNGGMTGRLFRVAGLRHNPAACEDAWERIFGFFDEHLAR
ncbi:dienelactone hydrolase family protein [Nocardia uniformis]|uniref:Dienelactone hydrolase family protein n=1 Tax=Nocardia uniformis TaxID=53432 RepID=A0A849BWM2_9NOCA|nr:dienelactone hydrolase family protein [Nocardia uniformis]NNH68700.1 dienelactone hydrolase family protein [Nocardia uniformis]